jgi:hypothetical protein
MSLIVAGRFDTFEEGERAAQALFSCGFVEEDVTMFFVNPGGQHARTPIGGDNMASKGAKQAHRGAGGGVAIGATIGAILGVAVLTFFHLPLLVFIIGAGLGAYIGSLAGAMSKTRHSPAGAQEEQPVRQSGVLLAVHVTSDTQPLAASILREHGAADVERATGRWQQGRWADFDATSPPQTVDKNSARNATHV